MIQTRLEITEYTAKVLDVIKEKYGLKNRSEALQKLALDSGQEYVEPNEMVLKDWILYNFLVWRISIFS